LSVAQNLALLFAVDEKPSLPPDTPPKKTSSGGREVVVGFLLVIVIAAIFFFASAPGHNLALLLWSETFVMIGAPIIGALCTISPDTRKFGFGMLLGSAALWFAAATNLHF
jgi:hypothetical protein